MSDLDKNPRYLIIGEQLVPKIHAFLLQENYDREFKILSKAELILRNAGFQILHPDMDNYDLPEINLEGPEKFEGLELSIVICELFGCELRYSSKIFKRNND